MVFDDNYEARVSSIKVAHFHNLLTHFTRVDQSLLDNFDRAVP